MKILIVSQYFWPEQFRVNELVKDLSEDCHEVTVYTGLPNYPDGEIFEDYLDNKASYSTYHGARVIRSYLVPRKKGAFRLFLNYLSFMVSSVFGMRRLTGDYDVVFFFQVSPIFSGLSAVLYSFVRRKPLVTWVQDLWPESLAATGYINSRAVDFLVGLFVRFIYSRSDVILVQSEAFVDAIEARFGRAYSDKIRYFPNWADGVFLQNSLPIEASFYSKKEGVFDVVFAGNVGAAQDFPTLIDAFSKLPNDRIRLIIVGDGSERLRLEQQVQRKGLDERIVFLGRHSVDYMPSVFSKADALLVSLRDEFIFSLTIPSKLQAYLTANKPIIASLAGAGAKLINESRCGFVSPPGDPGALAKNIIKLSALDEDARNNLAVNARKYYIENFDKESLRSSLIALFNELV